jgi:hypothetical protein
MLTLEGKEGVFRVKRGVILVTFDLFIEVNSVFNDLSKLVKWKKASSNQALRTRIPQSCESNICDYYLCVTS